MATIEIFEDFRYLKTDKNLQSSIVKLMAIFAPSLQSERIYTQLFENYQQALNNQSYDHETGIVNVTLLEQGWSFNLTGSNPVFVEHLIKQGKLQKIVNCKTANYQVFEPSLAFSMAKI